MKKYWTAFLSLFLAAALTACGNGAGNQTATPNPPVMDGTVKTTTQETAAEEWAERTENGLSVFQDGIERAESVLPYDGGLLISNFGGQDGGFVLYRKNGETETLIPPGGALAMPTGMAVKDRTLFVCDGDTVKAFDLEHPNAEARTVRFEEAGHLANDVAVYGDALYVSVTDRDMIFRLDIANLSALGEAAPEEWVRVPGPNGIAVADGVMYIASIPQDYATPGAENVIYQIRDLENPAPEALTDEPGLYDGVAVSGDGKTLYYSDWNAAAVTAFHTQTGERETLYQETGMGPADIAQADGVLYVPDLPGNRILEIPVPSGNAQTGAPAFDFATRTVTLNSGYEMPILGIGTYSLTPEEAENSVYHALLDGYRLIDTANAYMNEKAVGRGIRKSGVPREEIFVTTKLWVSEYDRAAEAIDETLERLGLDYVDLLLLHQPYGNYGKAYHAMEEAVKAGKVRSVGLSNFYETKFDEIMETAEIPPALLQVEMNPTYQQKDMREYVKRYGTVLEAWYPLGGRGHTQELFDNEIIRDIASTHGVSSAQIILRWHLQMGNIAIPGSSNPEHILENISIFDFALSDEEMARIETIDTNRGQFSFDAASDAANERMFTQSAMDFNSQP